MKKSIKFEIKIFLSGFVISLIFFILSGAVNSFFDNLFTSGFTHEYPFLNYIYAFFNLLHHIVSHLLLFIVLFVCIHFPILVIKALIAFFFDKKQIAFSASCLAIGYLAFFTGIFTGLFTLTVLQAAFSPIPLNSPFN